jgi:hypothetical protein
MFDVLKKTAQGADSALAGPWSGVLQKMQAGGTQAGASASAVTEQLLTQMQTTMREGRAAGLRAAQALAESYTTLVSGVLLGMSEALGKSTPAKDSRRK